MLIFVLVIALLAIWTALYVVVIRPKLVAYRYTAGIYAKLDKAEASLWVRILLWLKGIKVLIAGVITSAVPLAPVIYDKLAGVDWTLVFPTEKAKVAALIVTAAGIVGPMIMVALHNFGLADAAATEPQK